MSGADSSGWRQVDEGSDDYLELNFMPDEECPKQIRPKFSLKSYAMSLR